MSDYCLRDSLYLQVLRLNVTLDEVLLGRVAALPLEHTTVRLDPGAGERRRASPAIQRPSVSHPVVPRIGIRGAVSRRADRPLKLGAPAAATFRFA